MADVIVVAGTLDARHIIGELAKLNIKVCATVATSFGNELLQQYKGVEVFAGRLTSDGMADLIRRTNVRCMVDASHPFAREASINAMAACEQTGIKYLRFERNETRIEGINIISVESFEEAAMEADKFRGNIFLTTGSNSLEVFVKRIHDYKNRLFVRVLPESSVLSKCEGLGLTAKNIIAAKGPFSIEMNEQMLKHCNASVMVTKDSGEAGGTPEKVEAAVKLGIPVILVERPEIRYTDKVSDIEEVVSFVKKIMF